MPRLFIKPHAQNVITGNGTLRIDFQNRKTPTGLKENLYQFSVRGGWIFNVKQEVKENRIFWFWGLSPFSFWQIMLHNHQEIALFLRSVGMRYAVCILTWIFSNMQWNIGKNIWGLWLTSKMKSKSIREPHKISPDTKMTNFRAASKRNLLPTPRS